MLPDAKPSRGLAPMLYEVADCQTGKRVRRAIYKTLQGAQRRAEQLGAERYKARPSVLPDGYKDILARMRLVECPKQPGYR